MEDFTGISIVALWRFLTTWLGRGAGEWMLFVILILIVMAVMGEFLSARKKISEWVMANIGFFLSLIGVFVFASAFITETREIWMYQKEWEAAATRSMIFALGALGGIYGVILAARRLRAFEKQVAVVQQQAQTAEKNLFNDRLGRAIETLGREDRFIRISALRLLESLAKDSEQAGEEDNKRLILGIIHGFICNRAFLMRDKETGEFVNPKGNAQKRHDISTAIKTLFGLVDDLETRKKYPLIALDFRNIDLWEADLQGVNVSKTVFRDTFLQGAKLKDANLMNADLQGTDLRDADLQDAYLWRANLEDSKLGYANLQGANLSDARLRGADLSSANLRGADLAGGNLEDSKLVRASLQSVDLSNARLYGADLSNTNLHGADLSGVKKLKSIKGFTQIQFDKIIYRVEFPPESLSIELELPQHRAYNTREDGTKYFVESGRLVDEVLAEEFQACEAENAPPSRWREVKFPDCESKDTT